MNIPTKVKIGGILYQVHITEDWLGRGEADGQKFYDKDMGNSIYIAEHLSKEAKEVTFIHEMLHCMNTTIDHEFLDSLAEQIYQAFSDNDLLNENSFV